MILRAAEAALLVAIPQSPERRRPDRASPVAQKARDRVLVRGVEHGVIDAPLLEMARSRPAPDRRLALPMQALAGFLRGSALQAQTLVACCKGVDLQTLTGPAAVVTGARPGATVALLTGPSFAADIAKLPRIVTLNNIAIVPGKDGALALDATTKTFRYLDQEEIAAQQKNQKAAKGAKK